MASPEMEVDPLADSDQTKMNMSDSLEIPPNLSEGDLNLIRKMQMMSAFPGLQPKNTRMVLTPKSVPEILCTCPQKCDEKIPLKVRTYMFKYYHALSRDRPKQEMLLLRFIEMKSLAQRLKEDNKRVQCRYKAPTCMKAIDFVIEDASVSLSEDEESLENEAQPKAKKKKLNKKEDVQFDQMVALKTDPTIRYRIDKYGYTEVCQKAFMNVFLVPEKRVRAVRERLVASKRVTLEQEMAQTAVMNAELETAVKIAQDLAAGCKPLLQMLTQSQKLVDEEDPCDISSQLLDAIDSDIELVNNFFYNQLWKPEIFEKNFDGTKSGDKKVNGALNGTKSASNTMSSSLLDETFDSVINASASMADETADTMNETNQTENETSCVNETELSFNETGLNETPLEASEIETDAEERCDERDPLDEEKDTRAPQTAEDLEVANANANPVKDPLGNEVCSSSSGVSSANGVDEPLNLNIAATISSISPSSLSPDSSVSSASVSQSKGADMFATAIDLSVPSPHRNGYASKPNGNTSSASRHNGSTSISSRHSGSTSISARHTGSTGVSSRHSGSASVSSRSNGNFSSKSKSSHRNGHHRSEPMRKSSPSIQNILNNQHQALFSPNHQALFPTNHQGLFPPNLLPAALFDPDLSKYISGLESSISITPKSSRRHRGADPMTAATLTAQLIQNALNQSSLSVTANPAVNAAIGAKYSSAHSTLNQILNISDSVSITPTLVDNSK